MKNILLHNLLPFYWLVEQMGVALCSRLFISDFKSYIFVEYIQVTLYSKRYGCCTDNLQSYAPETSRICLKSDVHYKHNISFLA